MERQRLRDAERRGRGDEKEQQRARRLGERRCQGRGRGRGGRGPAPGAGLLTPALRLVARSKPPAACPPLPPAFVLWLERVPVGRERPLPSLEGPTAELTPTSAPEAWRPLRIHSAVHGGGDRP